MKYRTAFAGLALALASCLAQAQDFPSKSMQIVLPVPPGGQMDWLARTVGAELEKRWKHAVVVENKPGAGGLLASSTVARSQPDGHTLLLINSAVSVYPVLTKTDFDAEKDLVAIASAMESPYGHL